MMPKEFYEKYSKDRKDYETRGEAHSAMTIPYVMRKDGSDKGTVTPFARSQSFCGGLVNGLKSKMGLTLLPPSTSSFRFVPDETQVAEQYGDNQDLKDELNTKLSSYTKRINAGIETQQIRPAAFQMLEQMLIVGSAVVEKLPEDGIIIHTLKSFAVKLDRRGRALGICIVETMYKEDLPEDVTPTDEKQEEFELYTLMYKEEDGTWTMKQELDGEYVGDEIKYKNDMDLPFRYLGWKWATGESYHRPYVEDYYDDMVQLNHLSELLTRGSLAAAKVLFLVDETNGRTEKKEVAASKTGAYLYGNADDVTVVQASKNYDFQVPMEREANLKRELSKMFLSTESTTRDAERVTAYEVQIMARELESSTLGGIYSTMALGFNKWIVHQIMLEEKMTFDTINTEILTGLDALGRSQEAQKLDGFVQRMATLNMMDYIKEEELVVRYAAYDGIATEGLVNTSKEVAESRKQRQDAAMAAQADASVANSAGKVVENAAKG